MVIRPLPRLDPDAPVLVLDIGNTNIGVGTWERQNLKTPISVPTEDHEAFAAAWEGHASACPKGRPAATIISSVVPSALERVRQFIDEKAAKEALVIGDSIPLPLDVEVDDERAVGVDRVCAAAAAYDRLQTACTIISFGTAITVDLVDDDGSFLGGAILPGMRMQFQALHEHTAALPEVAPGIPETPFGKNTAEAIQTGVCRGIAGAVRGIVEGYATSLNRWPQTVATGGDAEFLAEQCDYIDTLVSHLTLRGVGVAYRKHLAALGV